MIKLKERYDCDWRLYDTETGKYVPNTAKNRTEAFICTLLENEARKDPSAERLNSVEEVLWSYYTALQLSKTAPLNFVALDYFVSNLDLELNLKDFKDEENFLKLAFCVMHDQRDVKKETNAYDIENFSRKYEYMNDEIFGKEEDKKIEL